MPSGHFREYILHLTMASRWLHDGFTTSSSLRIPFASTSYAKLPRRVSFVTASGIIVCPSCAHRVPIGRLRTCFGSTLAFYQIRNENRAKLKISYSCGHRVSKSARYDATLNKGVDQLCSFCEADLRLCFRLCRLLVFPCGDSNFLASGYFDIDAHVKSHAQSS